MNAQRSSGIELYYKYKMCAPMHAGMRGQKKKIEGLTALLLFFRQKPDNKSGGKQKPKSEKKVKKQKRRRDEMACVCVCVRRQTEGTQHKTFARRALHTHRHRHDTKALTSRVRLFCV